MRRPTYRELLERTDAPAGSAWGVRNGDEQLGSIASLTPERVRFAAGLVRRGARFNLDYPINFFDPPLSPTRHLAHHHIFSRDHASHRVDYLDALYLQSTSQIDGLRHQRHPDHGFYNGTPDGSIVEGGGPLGVDRWAEAGIAGRGVLVDLPRYLGKRGRSLDHAGGEPFSVALIEEALADQKTTLAGGDMLLVRTGWPEWYAEQDLATRQRLPGHIQAAGLAQTEETVAWLWDQEIALIASDNVAVESNPPLAGSAFPSPLHPGMLHPTLIALLGLALGELWKLDELAADCAEDGVYAFLVVAKPLNVRGGVGSPANALAIK